jgi:hypothetical protein
MSVEAGKIMRWMVTAYQLLKEVVCNASSANPGGGAD